MDFRGLFCVSVSSSVNEDPNFNGLECPFRANSDEEEDKEFVESPLTPFTREFWREMGKLESLMALLSSFELSDTSNLLIVTFDWLVV